MCCTRLAANARPCKFQRVWHLGSVTARHYSSGRKPNFAALNRGCHLYSAGRPSRWALAHILVQDLEMAASTTLWSAWVFGRTAVRHMAADVCIWLSVCPCVCTQKSSVQLEFWYWSCRCGWIAVVCRSHSGVSVSTYNTSHHACHSLPALSHVSLQSLRHKPWRWYATIFHQIDEKVVSSCLLQYKPVCVINFDKLRRKMLKRTTLVVCLV